jgi:ABC-type Mn2+/Zn2+ transport system permease subunit
MSGLLEILQPSFLLRDALVGSVLVGLVCPLVGAYFVLRRMIFLGVALPQLSAAGIAFSFLAYRAIAGFGHEHGAVGAGAGPQQRCFVFKQARGRKKTKQDRRPPRIK